MRYSVNGKLVTINVTPVSHQKKHGVLIMHVADFDCPQDGCNTNIRAEGKTKDLSIKKALQKANVHISKKHRK